MVMEEEGEQQVKADETPLSGSSLPANAVLNGEGSQ